MVVLGQKWSITKIEQTYDPTRGPVTSVTFRGVKEELDAIAATTNAAQTVSLIQSAESPLSELTVTTPDYAGGTGAEIVTAKYELLGNDIQQSMYEHPRSMDLPAATIENIKTRLADPSRTDLTFTGDAATLYSLLVKESNSYIASQYVFRLTLTISNNYATKVVFSNVNRIYTTAQLLTETAPPSSLVFSIAQIPGPDFVVPIGFMDGWLKKSPTVVSTSNNKLEVTIEYWRYVWSKYVYELAT